MIYTHSMRQWLAISAILLALSACASGLARAQTGGPPAAPAASEAGGDVSPAIPSRSLLRIVQSGGALMAPILFCSVILLIFVFERAICLRRGHIIPRPFVRRFILQLGENRLDQKKALQLCEENGSAVAQVFAGAARKWGRSSVEIEQGMIDAGERVTNHLRRNLRVLNGVATVCPLLGLLGTVVGMIRAFNAIASSGAMGRPQLLADGISQALLTTAAGLSVAIPALIFYLYFVSCVDRRIMEIDSLGEQVAQLLSGDVQVKPTGRKRKVA